MPYPHAIAIQCAGSRAGSCHHFCRQAPMPRGRAQHKHTLYLLIRTAYAHPSPYTCPGLPRLTTFDGYGSMPSQRVDPPPATSRDSEHPRYSFRVYPRCVGCMIYAERSVWCEAAAALYSRVVDSRCDSHMPPGMLPHVRQHPGGLFLRSDGTHSKTTVILSDYPAPDPACQQAN